jgi:hypothetical protein
LVPDAHASTLIRDQQQFECHVAAPTPRSGSAGLLRAGRPLPRSHSFAHRVDIELGAAELDQVRECGGARLLSTGRLEQHDRASDGVPISVGQTFAVLGERTDPLDAEVLVSLPEIGNDLSSKPLPAKAFTIAAEVGCHGRQGVVQTR